jgi:glycine cleavage system aminomethyltransferase T
MASESDSAEPIDPCERHASESQRLQPDRTPEPPSTPSEGTRQDGCIVTRLRQTRANMIGTDDEQHYWDCQDAANEIERLRLTIRRLAEQDATLSVQGGNVTVTMDATLTDEEREAIEWAMMEAGGVSLRAATLRGLLERTK